MKKKKKMERKKGGEAMPWFARISALYTLRPAAVSVDFTLFGEFVDSPSNKYILPCARLLIGY